MENKICSKPIQENLNFNFMCSILDLMSQLVDLKVKNNGKLTEDTFKTFLADQKTSNTNVQLEQDLQDIEFDIYDVYIESEEIELDSVHDKAQENILKDLTLEEVLSNISKGIFYIYTIIQISDDKFSIGYDTIMYILTFIDEFYDPSYAEVKKYLHTIIAERRLQLIKERAEVEKRQSITNMFRVI